MAQVHEPIKAHEVVPGDRVIVEHTGPRGGKKRTIGRAVGFYGEYLGIATGNPNEYGDDETVVPWARMTRVLRIDG